MKKFIVALMTVIAGTLGLGVIANAQYGATEITVVVTPPTVKPGGEVKVTVGGCQPGERIDVELVSERATVTCNQAGTATVPLKAPTSPGTYPGTAVTFESNQSVSFSVTVVAPTAAASPAAGSLPQTGSGGLGTTAQIAIGLLAVGAALVMTSLLRRSGTGAVG